MFLFFFFFLIYNLVFHSPLIWLHRFQFLLSAAFCCTGWYFLSGGWLWLSKAPVWWRWTLCICMQIMQVKRPPTGCSRSAPDFVFLIFATQAFLVFGKTFRMLRPQTNFSYRFRESLNLKWLASRICSCRSSSFYILFFSQQGSVTLQVTKGHFQNKTSQM